MPPWCGTAGDLSSHQPNASIHLVSGPLKPFVWTSAVGIVWRAGVAQAMIWTCTLEGPKRCVVRVGTLRTAVKERGAGSGTQRKPEYETCKGEFAGTESLGSLEASSSDLTVSVWHHRGPYLFPHVFPLTRLSSTATAFSHSSIHTRASIPDVPQHQPTGLSISFSRTPAPLLA